MAETIIDSAQEIARVLCTKALAGDLAAIAILAPRLWPVRRGVPIKLEGLPKISSVADIPNAIAYVAKAVARGEISPDEGEAVAAIFDKYRAAAETCELAARLEALERAMPTGGGHP